MHALFESWFRNREADDLLEIAKDYREVVFEQRDLLMRKDAEIAALRLEHSRWARSVIQNFLVVLENPDLDIRDLLIDALRDFDDEIARLEEHAPA